MVRLKDNKKIKKVSGILFQFQYGTVESFAGF